MTGRARRSREIWRPRQSDLSLLLSFREGRELLGDVT